MSALLTWGGVLSTPFFHVPDETPGGLIIADVTFPHSTGRTPMILGSKQSEWTSDQVVFAEEGDHANRLVAATYSEIVTMKNAVIAKMQSSSFLGTLVYTLNSGYVRTLTNMQCVEFKIGPWEQFLNGHSDKVWQRVFTARFVKWH